MLVNYEFYHDDVQLDSDCNAVYICYGVLCILRYSTVVVIAHTSIATMHQCASHGGISVVSG